MNATVTDFRFVIKGATADVKAIYLTTKDTIGTASVFRPMPAMLVAFTGAHNITPSGFILKWKTQSEQNLNNFQIERSNDAHNFTIVNDVTAVGTPTTDTSYLPCQAPFYKRFA